VTAVQPKRDEELLADHVAGTPGAFDVLVGRYAEDLFNFFQRFIGNRSAADDLVQETFLQVHLSCGSFDPARAFKPWLYTIAANKARDHIRTRKRRPLQSLDGVSSNDESLSAATLLESNETDAADVYDDNEQRQRVRAVIGQMSEAQRLILVLGYYQRLPYAEIADVLGVPVGTVKSRLHAAVAQFAKLWSAVEPTSTS
jgi:RNA polymerase sigma-70 factor, ECF subfamily